MKRIASIFLTIAALFALAACGSPNDTAAPSTDAAVTEAAVPDETSPAADRTDADTQTTAAETTQTAVSDYKAAYASVIKTMESKYGAWTPVEDNIIAEWCGTGILFCDLFDWDRDGDPELFVGYSTEQHVSNDAAILCMTDLEVFTFEQGEARQILHGKPGRSYMITSSYQDFCFLRDTDGSIVLCLPHSENVWDNESLTQYWYRDGKVTSRELYAQAENYEDNDVPPTLNVFKIDGKKVDKAQYDKAKMENEDDVLFLACNHMDYDALKKFLNSETDSYSCAFLTSKCFHSEAPERESDSEPIIVPAWAADAVSTYR